MENRFLHDFIMGGEKKKKGNGRATITAEQSVNPIIIAKNLI